MENWLNGSAVAFDFKVPRDCGSNPTWYGAKRTQKDPQAAY